MANLTRFQYVRHIEKEFKNKKAFMIKINSAIALIFRKVSSNRHIFGQ